MENFMILFPKYLSFCWFICNLGGMGFAPLWSSLLKMQTYIVSIIWFLIFNDLGKDRTVVKGLVDLL